MPLHVVRKNTGAQIRRVLQDVFNVMPGIDNNEIDDALREAETAAYRVIQEGLPVELAPRSASLRRLQHRVATRHRLLAQSVGSEPRRHLVLP